MLCISAWVSVKWGNITICLSGYFQGKNLYILYIFVCDILYISIIRVDALNLRNWIRMCFYVSYGLTCGQKIKKYVLHMHTKKLSKKCQFRTVSIMQCYIWRGAILTIFSTRKTSGLLLLLCCCHHCCSQLELYGTILWNVWNDKDSQRQIKDPHRLLLI